MKPLALGGLFCRAATRVWVTLLVGIRLTSFTSANIKHSVYRSAIKSSKLCTETSKLNIQTITRCRKFSAVKVFGRRKVLRFAEIFAKYVRSGIDPTLCKFVITRSIQELQENFDDVDMHEASRPVRSDQALRMSYFARPGTA